MTTIEWTEATWNPIVGCSVVSLAPEHVLTAPLRRRKPTTYFVNSMGDLFHEDVPDSWIDRVFAVMALAPQHTFQVLTKRSERMREYMHDRPDAGEGNLARWATEAARMVDDGDTTLDVIRTGPWPLPNVWLGVSAENEQQAVLRIPDLLDTPAAVRFASIEPMLGPIDLNHIVVRIRKDDIPISVDALVGYRDHTNGNCGRITRLDWVIVGGESGPGARPMHPDWARSIRDQCHAADVPFFMKQIDKKQPIPPDLMVREMPQP